MALTTFSGPVVSQNGFIDSSFTNAERDAIVNPQPGLLIYNTTDNVYQVCTVGGGTPTWDTAFGGGGGGGSPFPYLISNIGFPTVGWGPATSVPILFSPDGLQATKASGSSFGSFLSVNTLATPFDLNSSITINNVGFGPGLGYANIGGFFNAAGTEYTSLGVNSNTSTSEVLYLKYTLSTPFDMLTAVYSTFGSAFTGAPAGNASGAALSADGTKLIISLYGVNSATDTRVYELSLVNPYDVSSFGASIDYDFTSAIQTATTDSNSVVFGLAFNPAGTVAYVTTTQFGSTAVAQFKLGTPYNLNSQSQSYFAYFTPSSGLSYSFFSWGITVIGNSEKLVVGFETNFQGGSYSTATLTAAAPPNITSVSPSSGAAGANVIITGTGFSGFTSITFNGVSASLTSSPSDTTLYVSAPSGLTGTVDVTVTTPLGSSTEVGAFTYTIPTTTTYTEGVDYAPGGVTRSGAGSGTNISINQSSWFNITDFNNLLTKNSGTVFNIVQDGTPNSVSTYTNWNQNSPGQYQITGLGNQYGPGGNQSSISFAV